jgi:hypothetical protein
MDLLIALVGRRRGHKNLSRCYFHHSLCIFYQAVTWFLGFPHYGDEYPFALSVLDGYVAD